MISQVISIFRNTTSKSGIAIDDCTFHQVGELWSIMHLMYVPNLIIKTRREVKLTSFPRDQTLSALLYI